MIDIRNEEKTEELQPPTCRFQVTMPYHYACCQVSQLLLFLHYTNVKIILLHSSNPSCIEALFLILL